MVDVLDGIAAGASFIPGYGWAIEGLYLIADGFSKGLTDKSIDDHLNEATGNISLKF